jgi:uncharacterized protein
MAEEVFFHALRKDADSAEVSDVSRFILNELIESQGIELAEKVPLKVHFGEVGNETFVRPENYNGVIDYLMQRNVESCFIETNVLYGGQRYKSQLHERTAAEHGFTRLPVVIADGEHGESYEEVKIDGKHFDSFKIGGAFLDFEQIIVLSHFKGHMLSGFGGAIKQLGMGFAAKGGKMAIHIGEKPRIRNRRCMRCNICKTRCNEDALVIEEHRSYIIKEKCVGCGACIAICPYNAITIFSLRNGLRFLGIGNPFIEKLVEGAYAGAKGKRNIYLNYAISITRGCDCESRRMKPVMNDMGIFASTDPVAVDKACWDMARKMGRRFRGAKTFEYAERIGLGSSEYQLIDVTQQ